MNKISDLIKERVFIVNKENLTKEDYERIAEIEIEISEIKKSGKDNNVPIKKTNFEKLIENDKDNLILAISNKICIDTDKCKVDVINTMDYNDCGDCFHARNGDCTPELKKWLESEVENDNKY